MFLMQRKEILGKEKDMCPPTSGGFQNLLWFLAMFDDESDHSDFVIS
jgi:hypothetical protein